MQLQQEHPTLLAPSAVVDFRSQLPADVWCIDREALRQAGACKGDQWCVVAGWECQDLSAGGSGAGLQGSHSNTFYALVNALSTMQMLQGSKPPAYIVENVCAQFNYRHEDVREYDYPATCAVLGEPVALDAARFGSYAHRFRNFWTNLACTKAVGLVAYLAKDSGGQ